MAGADEPTLDDMIVTAGSQDLIFFSTLRDGFNKELIESIQSGLPIQIVYHLELRKGRRLWFDRTISHKMVTYSVKYDLLKEEYLLARDNDGHREEKVTKDFGELKRWVGHLYGITLADRGAMEKEGPYHVRAKVEVRLPKERFLLKYIFLVTSLLDFRDGWVESSTFMIKK